jgi:2-phospho-L-lactate guanylyltransferase
MPWSLPDSRLVVETWGISWGVVVPVKRLDLAKTRLAAYGDSGRRSLALAFAADVVVTALQVADVLVVTDDEEAAALLTSLGAQVVRDDPDAGLNPALEHGAEVLRTADSSMGVATLSADLPALTPSELRAALSAVGPEQRAFVADVDGTGTTLLAAGPGAALLPAFGAGSRAGHLTSGAVELQGGPGLRRDVDTPEDLTAALLLGVGTYTAAAAKALV